MQFYDFGSAFFVFWMITVMEEIFLEEINKLQDVDYEITQTSLVALQVRLKDWATVQNNRKTRLFY